MRSRFSAYCTQSVDYILRTYHPLYQSELAKEEIQQFANSSFFIDLTVTDRSPIYSAVVENTPSSSDWMYQNIPKDALSIATVTFAVRFLQDDKLHSFAEQSRFIQNSQGWFYFDGQLTNQPALKLNRNELCPCGSGIKFKRCQHPRRM